jgi:hypothetical protein
MMNSTNFANSKRRVITLGPRGAFRVTKKSGEVSYSPVARFRKAPDGSMVKLTETTLPKVPEAIRPARVAAAKQPTRMVRKTKAAPANARKNVIVVSPGGTLYKNKRSKMTLKRATIQKKLRNRNPFAALNKALMR